MSTSPHRIPLLVLAVLALALLASAPVGAADEVAGYGDPGSLIVGEAEEGPDRCPLKSRRAGKLAYGVALDRAWARARKWGAKGGYKRFRASADWKSARRARGAAVLALAGGKQSAALTALLRAAALEPRNARYALDAGVVLAQVGMVQEAAAFVTQAGRLKAPRTQPMGIPFRSHVENARGFVLLLAGDFKSAEKVLAGVEKRTPLLAEARINRWAAKACRTGKPRPRPEMRRDAKAPRLDLSGGASAPGLPEFKAWPQSPKHAWALTHGKDLEPSWTEDRGRQIRAEKEALGDAHARKWDAARDAWEASLKDQPGSWLTWRRVSGLNTALAAARSCEVGSLGEFAKVPEIAAVVALCERAEKEQQDAINYDWPEDDVPRDTDSDRSVTCEEDYAYYSRALPPWRTELQEAITAQQAWFAALYPVHTAITAQMPTALGARAHLWLQTIPLDLVSDWLFALEHAPSHEGCGGEPERQNGEASASAGPDGSGCSGTGLGMFGIQFKFGPMKLSVNCDRAALEIASPGWASAFTEVSYAWGSGRTTVFFGGQASHDLGPMGASARGGASFTFEHGDLVDVAIRGEASLGGSIDELTIDAWTAGLDYHFSPAY